MLRICTHAKDHFWSHAHTHTHAHTPYSTQQAHARLLRLCLRPCAGSHDTLAAGLSGNQTGQAALFDWADKTLGQGLSHVTKSVKTLLSGTCPPPGRVAS